MATTILPATEQTYCNSLTSYSRFRTREVAVGDVPLGADNPIRVQSMTTTDTMDTLGTVEQAIRMIEAGCEYVRITAPSINEAKNLENIKRELRARGYKTPLVADIHFTPNAAEIAARIVEKVRVNPGNYADKKKFEVIEYTDAAYEAELARIRERFTPLVNICKEYGTAMRIGTNHGSLSDRIMSRYGDTPHGMVESAMEFLRICEELSYYNIVLSMKASNPQVMVQAYRLLVHTMIRAGMNYPLHLGVTEAGDGEDGRIKSAMGIGTLLEDGLGDTIRVSLTEDPEFEIPVALALVRRYDRRAGHAPITPVEIVPVHPFLYTRRSTHDVGNLGGANVPRVVADFSRRTPVTPATLFAVGYNYSMPLDKWNVSDIACDYLFLGDTVLDFELPGTLRPIYTYDTWLQLGRPEQAYPLLTPADFADDGEKSATLNFIAVTPETLTPEFRHSIRTNKTIVLVLETENEHAMPALRWVFFQLLNENIDVPIIIKRSYAQVNELEFRLHSATDTGGLLLDGMGDGVWLTADTISPYTINSASFGILQASRTRISRTEYISCPSCGRTLFDLQETTAKIRARTDHLKGVKIAIMGCIVNGPGEMADADYGYVGSGPGKITLYKGKTVVRKNVVAGQAVDELIGLIREHGDWVEKEEY